MTQTFENFNYGNLKHLQVGRIGEYYVKFCLTLFGIDVYTTEVDDKGIDFVIRLNGSKYIDIQVKTIREKTSYVYVNKDSKSWTKPLRDNLYLALVILKNNSIPQIYIIPAIEWNNPNELLKSNDYFRSEKSKPDWGINISKKNMKLLEQYNLVYFINEINSKNYVPNN